MFNFAIGGGGYAKKRLKNIQNCLLITFFLYIFYHDNLDFFFIFNFPANPVYSEEYIPLEDQAIVDESFINLSLSNIQSQKCTAGVLQKKLIMSRDIGFL